MFCVFDELVLPYNENVNNNITFNTILFYFLIEYFLIKMFFWLIVLFSES